MNTSNTDIALFRDGEVTQPIQNEFVSEWQKVEGTLVKVEKYQGVLMVPSYMGLRNAGRHFIEAVSQMQQDQSDGITIALRSAVDELRRARHDAIRSLVNYCHYKLLLIEEEHSSDQIFSVCPEYFEIRDRMEDVNTRLTEDFQDIHIADKYFQELEDNYLVVLLPIFEKMSHAKNAALDGLKSKELRENRYKKLAIAGFSVGVIGVALAVLAFFI